MKTAALRRFLRRFLGLFLAISWGSVTACASASHRAATADDEPRLEPAFASRAVQLSLRCVGTEKSHYNEGQGPGPHAVEARHPAFYGCVDWHSAVHGHWAMLRVVDTLPELPERDAIVAVLARHLTGENIQGELAFLRKNPHFEEPYGWGWGLRLGEELRRSSRPEARAWREAFAPLEAYLAESMRRYLRGLSAPNRVGMHENTAFALIHAWDSARANGDAGFRAFLELHARRLYLADHDCPLDLEPGRTDFLSPCFAEADLMRRILAPDEFRAWFARLLPTVGAGQLRPVPPAHLRDPYEVHLVGLMYEKASALSAVAALLSTEDARRPVFENAVKEQVDTAGRLLFDTDYGGTHWLASFAIYYYTGVGR